MLAKDECNLKSVCNMQSQKRMGRTGGMCNPAVVPSDMQSSKTSLQVGWIDYLHLPMFPLILQCIARRK